MDATTSLAISSSALHAQRLRMDVIAANLANAQSTRTPEGGPYKRHDVVLEAMPGGRFDDILGAESGGRPDPPRQSLLAPPLGREV